MSGGVHQKETLEVHRRDLYSEALSEALSAFETISDKVECSDPVAISFDVHFVPAKRTFAFLHTGEFWRLSAGTMWATSLFSASPEQKQVMLDVQHELCESVQTFTSLNDLMTTLQDMNTGTTRIRAYCTHVGIVWCAIDISDDYEDWLLFRYGALLSCRTVSSDAFALTELTAAVNAVRLADAYWELNGIKKDDPAAQPILERAHRPCKLRLVG